MAKTAARKAEKTNEAKSKDDKKAGKKELKAKKATKKVSEVALAAKKGACKIGGCKRTYRAKGYCVAHYRMWRHGAYGVARYKICKDEIGCRRPMATNRHGYCDEHFQQYYVKGVEVAHAPKAEAPKAVPAAAPAEKAG